MTNPEAVRYLRENLPTAIREITEQSREAVQQALLRGFTEGRPAAQIAREVRNSVGLTVSQEQAVSNFRRTLETGQMVGKHPGTRRLSAPEQARASSLFRQAREGVPAPQADIDAMVNRYHESLVNRRAKNIARTEANRAFGEGQEELWRQAVDRGLLDPAMTRRHWLVTPDERLRESHAVVPGRNPDGVPLDGLFDTPVGMIPGPRQSEVAGYNVNCRCTVVLEIIDDF